MEENIRSQLSTDAQTQISQVRLTLNPRRCVVKELYVKVCAEKGVMEENICSQLSTDTQAQIS